MEKEKERQKNEFGLTKYRAYNFVNRKLYNVKILDYQKYKVVLEDIHPEGEKEIELNIDEIKLLPSCPFEDDEGNTVYEGDIFWEEFGDDIGSCIEDLLLEFISGFNVIIFHRGTFKLVYLKEVMKIFSEKNKYIIPEDNSDEYFNISEDGDTMLKLMNPNIFSGLKRLGNIYEPYERDLMKKLSQSFEKLIKY